MAIGDAVNTAYEKTKDGLITGKEAVIAKLDADSDGQIGIEDIIVLSFKTPGVYINREIYLKKQFFKNHSKEQIELAVLTTPAHADIEQTEIDKIADEAIKSERLRVSGISTALGMPGGAAMAATIPADIIQ